jgi:hypothetical protein
MASIASLFLFVLACVAFAAVIAAVANRPRRRRRSEPSDDGGGGGGSVRRGPPRPREPSSPGEPPWWPEFERELAEYIAGRHGARLPAGPRG